MHRGDRAVTTQAREGIETIHYKNLHQSDKVTTQARMVSWKSKFQFQ